MSTKKETPPMKLESVDDADKALAAADAAELHRLFMQSRAKHEKMRDALDAIVNHYAGSMANPRIESQSTDAINAMKEVALAAINLAKQVNEDRS